jgi:hypothetical protein
MTAAAPALPHLHCTCTGHLHRGAPAPGRTRTTANDKKGRETLVNGTATAMSDEGAFVDAEQARSKKG